MHMFSNLPQKLIYLLVFTGSCIHMMAQSVQYFPPFDMPVAANQTLQLAGKVENNYLLYHTQPGTIPELMVFNEQGQIAGVSSLDFIRPGFAQRVNMVTLPNRLNLIVQEIREHNHYVFVAGLNKDGKLRESIHYIDSTRIDLYGAAVYYNVISSADKKYSLLYRIIQGFSSTQILFNGILLNEKNEILGSASFYIPFNTELESTDIPLLTNQGIAFLPVFDKATNFRLGTSLRIFQTAFKNKPPVVTEIYLKENKPCELLLDWYAAKNQLVIGGLYYNFYSKNIEGSLAGFITPGTSNADTIIYFPLDKSFKKGLKNRIYGMSTNDAVNTLQSRYFKVDDKGAVMLLADMFTNSSNYNNSPFPGFPNTETTNPGNLPLNTRPNSMRNQPGTLNNQQLERDIAAGRNSTTTPSNRTGFSDRASGTTQGRNRTSLPQNTSTEYFVNSQNSRLTNPYNYSPATTGGGDILARNKSLDYKSVFFSLDATHTRKWKNWTRSLFVPGTLYSNVILLPVEHSIGLLNYEINNRNKPYLVGQKFESEEIVIRQLIDNAGNPILFYKKNAVPLGNSSLLTLYADEEQNRIGLAIIKW